MKAATKLASLPFGELDRLVKAIGECKSKSEEDRIISAEVDVLKQRLSDPRLDKSRGREYMVRVIYCEMLGHDVSFAYIPVLQMASDPNLLNKKAAYLCLTQLLDYKHELVLLLVNTLLSDLKNDNFVVISTALVVASKLIGADLINAVLPHVIERLSHPREAVRKKAVMALLHFHQMDPQHTGPLAGVELERHFRSSLCDKEPSVMAATLNALIALAADNPVPFRALIPSLTSILKQVVEHRLPKAYDYHRFPAPFIQIKLLKLLRLLAAGDKAASDNMAAVVSSTLRRAASGGNHTIGHAIVYEAVRTITAMYPNPALLASAAEAVAVLIKSSAHNLKYCGLTALAAITRVSPQYAQEHQMAVIDCLEDPDDTLKLKTLELLVTMTKANNVQVVVERLMAFLRSMHCGGDEVLRRHIAGQIVELAEKYAPDTAWYIRSMAEVFEVAGDVLQPQLAHNLCRLVAEQDSELHSTAVQMFLEVLDKGTASRAGGAAGVGPGGLRGGKAMLPDLLLCCICWVLGEYGGLASQLPPPHRVNSGQVMDKLCAAVATTKPSSTVRAYLLTALMKLAAQQQQQQHGGGVSVLRPEAQEVMHKAHSSRSAELQQRAQEAEALLSLPTTLLSAVLPFDGSCEEFEAAELEEGKGLTFLDGYVAQALSEGATPYNPPPELSSVYTDEDLDALGLPGMGTHTAAAAAGGHHKLRFDAYDKAQAPTAATAASAGGGAFGSSSSSILQQQSPVAAAAAQQQPQQQWHQPAAVAAPAQPQPMLKGAGKGRWGPAEFSSSSSAAPPSSHIAAAGPPVATAAPTAAAASTASRSSASTQRVLNERGRLLAASLFGSGGDSSSSSAAAAGIRGGKRSQPAAAAAAPQPVVADLLGGDVLDASAPEPPPAAAAATGARPSAGDGLDLLLELDSMAPAAADPLAALGGAPAPVAGPAAALGGAGKAAPVAGGLLDLDSILSSPTPAPAAVPAAADMLDLGLISLSSPQPQQQQQPLPQMPVPAAAGAAAKAPGSGPVAMRGGQPAKGSTKLVDDPFKDLFS